MALICLRDIATVQLGLILARKKADSNSSHVYKRLTLRSMENNGINMEATESFYSSEFLQNEYLTMTGTIVMKLFSPFNPVVISKETEGLLFPSQMVSIRPMKTVLPEYLCLYLSQEFVSECLLANYFWIAQKAITVDSLANLKIRIPSLKNQQIICDCYQNHCQLRKLRENLVKEEQTMMRYILSKLSKEEE